MRYEDYNSSIEKGIDGIQENLTSIQRSLDIMQESLKKIDRSQKETLRYLREIKQLLFPYAGEGEESQTAGPWSNDNAS